MVSGNLPTLSVRQRLHGLASGFLQNRNCLAVLLEALQVLFGRLAVKSRHVGIVREVGELHQSVFAALIAGYFHYLRTLISR